MHTAPHARRGAHGGIPRTGRLAQERLPQEREHSQHVICSAKGKHLNTCKIEVSAQTSSRFRFAAPLYRHPRAGLLALLLAALGSGNASAASFDCAAASSTLEKTICADSQLSKADEEMAKAFAKQKDSLDAEKTRTLLKEQRAWLKQRTDNCAATDVACLRALYNERIDALNPGNSNIVPFVVDNPSSFQGIRGTCGFTELRLPQNAVLYAAGEYTGRPLDVQIDQSGHQATQFDVIVNSPDKPVALLLGAYEPSIWNIGWTQGTRILAVVASGYHRQAVAGLPKSTPILISTYDNRGVCGYTYFSNRTLQDANPFATKVFGKAVDMVFFASAGKIVIGNPELKGAPMFTSRDNPPESFIDKSKPLAGPAGIRDAVAKGLLRPATQEDANAWASRKAQSLPKDSLPPVAGGSNRQVLRGPMGDNVYVIVKPFRLPAGLYGGNSATFYLADGVSYPEGELGHSTLYDFNTMTCRGVICNAR